MKTRIRTNGTIIFLTVILIALFPSRFLRHGSGTHNVVFACGGMALVMSGLLLRVCSRGYKSENSGGGHALVKGGPYRLVRNPMYLGIFLIGLGVILISFQWWVLYAFILFLTARYYTLIVKEEKLLEQSFGDEYIEYKTRTPRLFPTLSQWLAKNAVEYLPLRWKWLRRELNSVIILPLVIAAIETWKSVRLGHRRALGSELLVFMVVVAIFVLFAFRLQRNYECSAK